MFEANSLEDDWHQLDQNSLERMQSGYDPIALDAIRSDLESGYHVFAPKQASTVSWYRIHPATGETLGMGMLGDTVAGTAGTEEVNLLANLAWALVVAVLGYFGCYAIGSGSGKGIACLYCAAIAFLAAFVGPFAVGAEVIAAKAFELAALGCAAAVNQWAMLDTLSAPSRTDFASNLIPHTGVWFDIDLRNSRANRSVEKSISMTGNASLGGFQSRTGNVS